MEAVKSSSSDFKTICRTCLCDVKQILAFHIDSVVTHQDPIGEILSRTTSKQVHARTLTSQFILCIDSLIQFFRR